MIAWNKSNASPVNRQKSPLEEDVWLMPAGSVDVEPPAFNSETQICSWNGSQWVVADIPVQEPEPTPEPVPAMEQLRMQRNSLLVQTDWRMLPDYPGTNQTDWQTYRQALRDITTQTPALDSDGNLTGITWPTAPND